MALFGSGASARDKRSSIVNSAKTFLANVRFLSVDDPVHTIVVTSAVPNEGKTFVTANLASAIATSGQRVLLVESDMRRRSMASSLGVHARKGIYEVLSSPNMSPEILEEAVISTQIPNLFFLDAEPHLPSPSDILNSERFTRFIEMASSIYDYVVFDTPPVGTFVDAAVLGAKVDAVFLVVRENFTKKAEVAAAAEQLRKSGCNLAGVVMNYCERRDSEYYYEYYYTTSGHDDSNAPGSTGFIPPISEEGASGGIHMPLPQRPKRINTEGRPEESSQGSSMPLPKRPERPRRHSQVMETVAEPEDAPVYAQDMPVADSRRYAEYSSDEHLYEYDNEESEAEETDSSEESTGVVMRQPLTEEAAAAYEPASETARAEHAPTSQAGADIMDTNFYVALSGASHQESEDQAQQQVTPPVRYQVMPRNSGRRKMPYIPPISDDDY